MRKKWIPPSYSIINTTNKLDAVIEDIKKAKILAFDIETNGLNPRLNCIVGFSIVYKNDNALLGFYFPLRHIKKSAHTKFGFSLLVKDEDLCAQLNPEIAMKFLNDLFTVDKLLIGHNIKFDLSFLVSQNVIVRSKLFDTRIAEVLIDSRKINEKGRGGRGASTSLKNIIPDYFDIGNIKKWKDFETSMDQVSIAETAEYCINDSAFGYALYEEQKPVIDKEFSKLFYKIEMPLISVLINIEMSGVDVNKKYLETLGKQVKLQLDKIEKDFLLISGKKINLKSPVQLQEFIYDYLKIPEYRKSVRRKGGKKEILATDSESIDFIRLKMFDKNSREYKCLSLISEYLQLSSLKSTHIDGLIKQIESDGKIHTDYDSAGSRSGRFASDPNLQNIPKRTDFDVRKAFIPENGKVFIIADWSGMQLRIAGVMSQDKEMLSAFQKNIDLHAKTARAIYETETPTEKQRFNGKTVNFSILFGATEYRISSLLGCSLEKAKKIVHSLHTLYDGFYKWKNETELSIERDGFALTFFGRKRRYDFSTMYPKYEMRSVINSIIQGTEADILKQSLVALCPLLKPNPEWGAKIVLHTHDEIVIKCFPDFVGDVKKCLSKAMEIKLGEILLPIEISVKKNLSKKKEKNGI